MVIINQITNDDSNDAYGDAGEAMMIIIIIIMQSWSWC